LIWLCFIGLTYNLWWLAPLGSLLILLLSFAAWPGENLKRQGLRIPPRHALVALVLLPLTTTFAWLLIDYVTRIQGVILIPVWQKPHPLELIAHTIGQTLNEEMILGALLLTSLASRFKRAPLLLVSAVVAALFAVLHSIFYAWRPEAFMNNGVLSTITLLTIFAVGLLRNNLILAAGNIAFAWAIHLGWNLIFMDSSYVSIAQARLAEPEVFNLVLGNVLVLGVIAAFAAGTVLYLRHAR
jgi:membrane protease YdiL (CAAX protease family)